VKADNFSHKVSNLCLNQAFARDSAVIFYFISNYKNYLSAIEIASFLGQSMYLFNSYWDIRCSSISAFYDDENQ
jgi:hypothetical protein